MEVQAASACVGGKLPNRSVWMNSQRNLANERKEESLTEFRMYWGSHLRVNQMIKFSASLRIFLAA